MGNYMSNQLSYRHTQREMARSAMEAGGCGTEFRLARTYCAGRKKTSAEVYECIEWTSRLRRCMEEGKNCHLKNYVKLMEEGLDQDEGKKYRYKSCESEEERWRWRWWTGMIRVPQQPDTKNKFSYY